MEQRVELIIKKINSAKLQRTPTEYANLKFLLLEDEKEIIDLQSEEIKEKIYQEVIKVSKVEKKDIVKISFKAKDGAIIDLISLPIRVGKTALNADLKEPNIKITLYPNELAMYENSSDYRSALLKALSEKLDVELDDIKSIKLSNTKIDISLDPDVCLRDTIFKIYGTDTKLSKHLYDIYKDEKFYSLLTKHFTNYLKSNSKRVKSILAFSKMIDKENAEIEQLPQSEKSKINDLVQERDSFTKKYLSYAKDFQFGFEQYFLEIENPNHIFEEKFGRLKNLQNAKVKNNEVIEKTNALFTELENDAIRLKLSIDELQNKIERGDKILSMLDVVTIKYLKSLISMEIESGIFDANYINFLENKEKVFITDLNSFKFLLSISSEALLKKIPGNENYHNIDRAGYKEKFTQVLKFDLADKRHFNYKEITQIASEILEFVASSKKISVIELREIVSKFHGINIKLEKVDPKPTIDNLKRIKKEIIIVNEIFSAVYKFLKSQTLFLRKLQEIGINAGERLTNLGVALGRDGVGFYLEDLEYIIGILNSFGDEKILAADIADLGKIGNKINSCISQGSSQWTLIFNDAGIKETIEKPKIGAIDNSILSWEAICNKFIGKKLSTRQHSFLVTFVSDSQDGEKSIENPGRIKLLKNELIFVKNEILSQKEEEEEIKDNVAKLTQALNKQAINEQNEELKRRLKEEQSKLDNIELNRRFTIKEIALKNGEKKTEIKCNQLGILNYSQQLLSTNSKVKTIALAKKRISSLAAWFSRLQDEIMTNFELTGGQRGNLKEGLYFELMKITNHKEAYLQEQLQVLRSMKKVESDEMSQDLDTLIDEASEIYIKASAIANPLDYHGALLKAKIPKNYFSTFQDVLIQIFSTKKGNIDPKKQADSFISKYSPDKKKDISAGLNLLKIDKIDDNDFMQLQGLIDMHFTAIEEDNKASKVNDEIELAYKELEEFNMQFGSTDEDSLSAELSDIYEHIKISTTESATIEDDYVQKLQSFCKSQKKPFIEINYKNSELSVVVEKEKNSKISAKKVLENVDVQDDVWKAFKECFAKLHKEISNTNLKGSYATLFYAIASDVFDKKSKS